MKTSDVWDSPTGSDRKNKRYLARWKVALVFDNTTTQPIFQTLTHDLSMTGVSVQYHSNEKPDTILTLLLAPPPIDNIKQRVIKLKAVVLSAVAFRGGFRLGMNFIPDAELEKLRAIIGKYVTEDEESLVSPEGNDFPTLNF
jgi:hypothetical protein